MCAKRQPSGPAIPAARLLLSLILSVVLLAGCSVGSRQLPVPAPSPSPSRAKPAQGPGHIFEIVLENREYNQVIGSRDAPYINQLAAQYVTAADYYAIRHPSLPNYLALLGGDTFGTTSDCTQCFVDSPNLVDELETSGRTWKSYQEGLPSPCFLSTQAGSYVMRHDPFLYFQDIRSDARRCRHVVPFTEFSTDLASGNLPNYVWITPSLQDDMHDGSIAEGDHWLAGIVPQILASDAWRQDGLLLITWDEGKTNAGCCGTPGGGHVPLLIIAPQGKPGYQVTAPSTHYTLLRLIEDLWGLTPLGNAATANAQPLLDSLQSK